MVAQDKHPTESHVVDAASELLKASKHKVCDVQHSIKCYSDEITHTVQTKPLLSLLVAGGIGFILSALLKR